MEQLTRQLQEELRAGGLQGSFVARDVDTGDEVGFGGDIEYPSASLVKIPLAIATLERIRRGELDAATPITLQPGRMSAPGPPGASKFCFPAVIAIGDLVYLSTALSDSVAADALFDLTPQERVSELVRDLGLKGITVRRRAGDLADTPSERLARSEVDLAHTLAIHSGTPGRGHRIPQLDTSLANTGTAASFVALLQMLWVPSLIHVEVAERVRDLMAGNVHRQRLTPDFASDATAWASKTGTLLNLRHEIGVVEHADGQTIAIAALTESRIPAGQQPVAEALIAHVARTLHDQLRQHQPTVGR